MYRISSIETTQKEKQCHDTKYTLKFSLNRNKRELWFVLPLLLFLLSHEIDLLLERKWIFVEIIHTIKLYKL